MLPPVPARAATGAREAPPTEAVACRGAPNGRAQRHPLSPRSWTLSHSDTISAVPHRLQRRYATAAKPFLLTSESSLSDAPEGRFSPRSHLLIRLLVTFR